MQQSKNVAMAFLLGTFLTGGVLGFSANKYITRDEVCTTRGVNPVVEGLGRRLGLNVEQRARFDSILDRRADQYRIAMAPIRSQMDSIKLNARDAMRQALTPEQKVEFEALLLEMRDSTRKDND